MYLYSCVDGYPKYPHAYLKELYNQLNKKGMLKFSWIYGWTILE